MNNSLYQISGALIALFEQIEENGGELTEELAQQLEIKENELTEKASGYLEIIGAQEAFISRIDEELKRLQARKKQAKRRFCPNYLRYTYYHGSSNGLLRQAWP